VTARKGIMMYSENRLSSLQQDPERRIRLFTKIEIPITNDCPTSTPLIPARMLMEFVQKTASIPM